MPPLPILVFAAVSVAHADTSSAFLISSIDTAETEHFSLQMYLIFLMLLCMCKTFTPMFQIGSSAQRNWGPESLGGLGSLEGDHLSTWCEVGSLWWGR